ncbi:unnamed protein product [Cylicostephanus goldi]|uniref:Uncharacterized protein n=1 Tax=Cylicostephanus goldi TaxID=71465 RepID=A0A3P6RVD5_CYLGO|nr:unnamed protein product [Cylicostephanus goldi]
MTPVLTVSLKVAKQKLTRLLNELGKLIEEADQFSQPWQFPTTRKELEIFLATKPIVVKALCKRIEGKKEYIWQCYNECITTISSSDEKGEDGSMKNNFEQYWEEKRGEYWLETASEVIDNLEKRLVELQCQEAFVRKGQERHFETANEQSNRLSTVPHRLFGNEIKIPDFDGKATEFDSFWELFEELVHKQPYSNIEKLSILLSCCKGDAARTLKMIPRTGSSYEEAINQLKLQYQDAKRTTMTMIRQLKNMKQARDDARSLRNTLSDIETIIATLRKNGEFVDTTQMSSMVIDTFPKTIQEEILKKEFDSGKEWNTADLIANIAIIVKRREHLENRTQEEKPQYSMFTQQKHAGNASAPNTTRRCVGCKTVQHAVATTTQWSAVTANQETMNLLHQPNLEDFPEAR